MRLQRQRLRAKAEMRSWAEEEKNVAFLLTID